jgi:hypothetical protein
MKTFHLSVLALVLMVNNSDNYAATPYRDDCCITTQSAMQESGQTSQPPQSTKTKTESEKKKKKNFPLVALLLPLRFQS